MVGANGFLGCITDDIPAAKNGTRPVGAPLASAVVVAALRTRFMKRESFMSCTVKIELDAHADQIHDGLHVSIRTQGRMGHL